MGARQLFEGGAAADLVEQALRLLGGGDEDLQRMDLLGRLQVRAVLLEPGAHLEWRRLFAPGLLRDPLLGEEPVAGLFSQLFGRLTVLREPFLERRTGGAGRFRQRIDRRLHLGVGHRQAGDPRTLHQDGPVDQRIEECAGKAGQFLRIDLRHRRRRVDDPHVGGAPYPVELALQGRDGNRRSVDDGHGRSRGGGRGALPRASRAPTDHEGGQDRESRPGSREPHVSCRRSSPWRAQDCPAPASREASRRERPLRSG